MSNDQWLLFLAGAVLPPAIIAYVGTLVMRRVAPRFGLVDHPAARKVHTTPTPLGGGIAIAAGVLLPFVLGTIAVFVVQTSPELQSSLPELARRHLGGLI